MPPDPTIWNSFQRFGYVHLALLTCIILLAVTVSQRRRHQEESDAGRRRDRLLGWTALLIWIATQSFELWPSRYDLYYSLPLHVCDLVGLAAPLAMLSRFRLWHVMLYYWGIGLSTQALLTPELDQGLAGEKFWSFWIPHGTIIVLAIYDLAARRYRPNWKDYAIAVVSLLIYIGIIIPVDLRLDVNYGFVGKGLPGKPSVIDFLGPWPLRVYKLIVGVAFFLAVITLPWDLVRRFRRGDRPNSDADFPQERV